MPKREPIRPPSTQEETAQAVKERDAAIAERDQALRDRDRAEKARHRALKQRDEALAERDHVLALVQDLGEALLKSRSQSFHPADAGMEIRSLYASPADALEVLGRVNDLRMMVAHDERLPALARKKAAIERAQALAWLM